MLALSDRADGRVDLVETRLVILHVFANREIAESFLRWFEDGATPRRTAQEPEVGGGGLSVPDLTLLPVVAPQAALVAARNAEVALDAIRFMHDRQRQCAVCARPFTAADFNLETCARCSRD